MRATSALPHGTSRPASRRRSQDAAAVIYRETPNCLHTATRAVDSLFLSTLKEHSGKAKAGDVLCMRCGNIWHRTSRTIIARLAKETEKDFSRLSTSRLPGLVIEGDGRAAVDA